MAMLLDHRFRPEDAQRRPNSRRWEAAREGKRGMLKGMSGDGGREGGEGVWREWGEQDGVGG